MYILSSDQNTVATVVRVTEKTQTRALLRYIYICTRVWRVIIEHIFSDNISKTNNCNN